MIRVKMCGITRVEDARAAAGCGAASIGLVFAPSPRQVSPDQAREIIRAIPSGTVCTVGVFMGETAEEIQRIVDHAGVDSVQLHDEIVPPGLVPRTPSSLIRCLRVRPSDTRASLAGRLNADPQAVWLLDSGAGSGRAFDWSIASDLGLEFPGNLILAGGLTPENVGDAIRIVQPAGVDVSTGIERSPGRKDPARMQAFMDAVGGA